MSEELYEVLSLSSRYLFTLLGVLIVLRAFFWLLSDRAEKRRRLKKLPFSGMIGEFVVLADGGDLHAGDHISIPWEGVLGSVRSCDVYVPGQEVRRQHLSFAFDPDQGLVLSPFRGCEALVNGESMNHRSLSLRHGSLLQVGNVLMRLRLFAGLDANAGFDAAPSAVTTQFPPAVSPAEYPPMYPPFPAQEVPAPAAIMPAFPAEIAGPAAPVFPQEGGPVLSPAPKVPSEPSTVPDSADTVTQRPPARRRRSDRWEVDWSE
ncbi:MAG: FHA domain-containing protein [Clostridia bacterium]|nr:FHA domain-containing protein [Clostridia bacterium]